MTEGGARRTSLFTVEIKSISKIFYIEGEQLQRNWLALLGKNDYWVMAVPSAPRKKKQESKSFHISSNQPVGFVVDATTCSVIILVAFSRV